MQWRNCHLFANSREKIYHISFSMLYIHIKSSFLDYFSCKLLFILYLAAVCILENAIS